LTDVNDTHFVDRCERHALCWQMWTTRTLLTDVNDTHFVDRCDRHALCWQMWTTRTLLTDVNDTHFVDRCERHALCWQMWRTSRALLLCKAWTLRLCTWLGRWQSQSHLILWFPARRACDNVCIRYIDFLHQYIDFSMPCKCVGVDT